MLLNRQGINDNKKFTIITNLIHKWVTSQENQQVIAEDSTKWIWKKYPKVKFYHENFQRISPICLVYHPSGQIN